MSTGNEKYFTIGEVSQLTGIKPTVLRFWEQEFEDLSPVKNKFGHRVYRQSEIDSILTIKKLLYQERLAIEGAKKFLKKSKKSLFKVGEVRKTYGDFNTSQKGRIADGKKR
ncbi:MAG TPA: MerR family transcriptional regulator [Spirochaetota bacterium]|mgnify:CR=1 FL=1|nr:MerR family transcriptional regulator [Spirochaetota bacterium]